MTIQPPNHGESSFTEKVNQWEQTLSPYNRSRKLDMSSSVLLVIDFQEFFLDATSHAGLSYAKEVEENIRALLSLYRERDLPVIFTRHAHGKDSDIGALGRWWRDPLMDSSEWSRLRIEPADGEVLVVKDRYDAFFGTDLDTILKDIGAKELVITGVMTDLCVETTARSAFVRDYDVSVVLDATTTQSDDLHLSALKTLAHGFAVVRKTSEITSVDSTKKTSVDNRNGGGT